MSSLCDQKEIAKIRVHDGMTYGAAKKHYQQRQISSRADQTGSSSNGCDQEIFQ